ncbi:acyl-CoA synthetase [Polaromonas sp.]|uniref:acyl-CoA synthetase n=1 Tax=Polaromonas sp. TaxID=1869339 RepID=UPI002FC6B381
MSSPYRIGMARNRANHVPLSPLSFLERTAQVYPQRVSVVHGERSFTWAQTYERCRRLASALRRAGVQPGDTVAALLPNVAAMVEAHFGVPMAGAVLNTLNTRLDAQSLAFQLDHGEARVLLTDPEYAPTVRQALRLQKGRTPMVVDVMDPGASFTQTLGDIGYECFLAQGDPAEPWQLPEDEWDAICLNYTSGTTGNPKGVVYHHRGAYLNAVSNVLAWQMPQHPVYLWTLPMFHCNGWCFPWTLALVAGTQVCLRRVDAQAIAQLVKKHRVTHLSGAPIVFNTLVDAWTKEPPSIGWTLQGTIAGAAPPPSVIVGAERLGIALTHVYGLTEVYGPAAVCAQQTHWAELPEAERARLNGRQGVPYPLQQSVAVLDSATMEPVPWDGETMGEIFFRGNLVMRGYLKNPEATEEAFAGGWFHTGDLGVTQPDGYIKIRDRSKDIIISGGENISSVEVEDVLYQHPAVLAAAVVAKPDARWGEVPCAFVELKQGMDTSEAELVDWCRDNLAHYKAPRQVIVGPLPKTSTGKIQKFVLREQVCSSSAIVRGDCDE